MFTDGITTPYRLITDTASADTKCVNVGSSGNTTGLGNCDNTMKFICMAKGNSFLWNKTDTIPLHNQENCTNLTSLTAHSQILLEDQSEQSDYGVLTDMKLQTCVNSTMMLSVYYVDHYRVNLIIPRKLNNGLVTVYFNQTVDCKGRQVSF